MVAYKKETIQQIAELLNSLTLSGLHNFKSVTAIQILLESGESKEKEEA